MATWVVGFDLDMTLVDSAAGIIGAVRHVCARYGVDVPESEIRRTLGLPLDRVFPEYLPGRPYPELLAEYRRHYARVGVPLSTPMPGAAEVLLALRESGAEVVVVTAKHGPMAEDVLAAAGLAADHVRGELFAEQKADVLREHGAWAYVGDHAGDMRAARSARAHGIGVATGPTSADDLAAAGASVVFPELSAVPGWCRRQPTFPGATG